MFVEFLKVLILLGIAVKAIAGRMWLEAATALAILYVGVALVIIVLFHGEVPGMSAVEGDPPSRSVTVGLLVAAALISGAISIAGLLRLERGTARREVTDLFVLVAILTIAQASLTAYLW